MKTEKMKKEKKRGTNALKQKRRKEKRNVLEIFAEIQLCW